MRAVVFCLIVLALLFAGHSIYDRVMAERKLSEAEGLLPNDPAGSYKIMKEVLDYNRLIALGKIGKVQDDYMKTIQWKTVEALRLSSPDPKIYPAVEQTVVVLDALAKQTGYETRKIRTAILKAAADSAAAIKETGSLSAWDNMTALFQNLGANATLMADVFDNYTKWFDEIKAVPRRPIGLRDAMLGATNGLREGLSHLQVKPAAADQAPVAPAPANLPDNSLIAAENSLNTAKGYIAWFKNQFGETGDPPELLGLLGKIDYDLAAIRLAHFQDHKATIMQTGSDYLAEFLIRSDTDVVPSASDMVSQWQQAARGALDAARQDFAKAASMPDPMKQAYTALAFWTEGQLETVFNPNAASPLQMRATQMTAGLPAPAATVAQAMQSTPRALLIVEVP